MMYSTEVKYFVVTVTPKNIADERSILDNHSEISQIDVELQP